MDVEGKLPQSICLYSLIFKNNTDFDVPISETSFMSWSGSGMRTTWMLAGQWGKYNLTESEV